MKKVVYHYITTNGCEGTIELYPDKFKNEDSFKKFVAKIERKLNKKDIRYYEKETTEMSEM